MNRDAATFGRHFVTVTWSQCPLVDVYHRVLLIPPAIVRIFISEGCRHDLYPTVL